MSLGQLSATHRHLKAVRTMLRNALDESGELTAMERLVIEMRLDAVDTLKHALARDIHAIRERLKAEAETGVGT